MGLVAALRCARLLATERIARRGRVIALLAVAERLLTPAAAWALFERDLATKLGVSMALAVVFTARSFTQKAFAARTEGDLVARAIASLMAGDVLRPSVLPREDARVELGQAVYLSALQLSQGLPALGADLLASALLTVVVVAVEPGQIVLLAVGLTLAAAIALYWSRGRLQKAVAHAWRLQDRAFDRLVDALEGRLEVVASGRRAAFVADALERSRAWSAASVRVAGSTVLSGRLPMLTIATVVAIVVSVDSRWRGSVSVRLADLALLASVTPAFAGVAQGLLGIVQAERSLQVVAQIVEAARPSREGKKPPARPPGAISFDGVSFRYGETNDGDVLEDLSFHWNTKDVLALSGANGSGKSTCLRLLLALARPRAGAIRVDGVDLSEIDADAWRARIAFLPQRPYLPPRATVRAAIRFLATDAGDDVIHAAIDRAGLTKALTHGGADALEVSVDSLSVGQRQRVALARLLCLDASIVLLDEPDANLDRAGVELVAQIVRELAKDHRIAFAAHTSELLALADEVVHLHAGRALREERGNGRRPAS